MLIYKTNDFIYFHAYMMLANIIVVMVINNWNDSFDPLLKYKTNKFSYWIKVIALYRFQMDFYYLFYIYGPTLLL